MAGVTTKGVNEDEAGLRLDRWFKRHYPELGHGRLERLLRTGQIRLDGKRAKAGDRIDAGQTVRIPPLDHPGDHEAGAEGGSEAGAGARAARPLPTITASEALAIQSRVLWRDDDVMVLDKPAGLAVQGGTGTSHHLDRLLDALRFEAVERPRLVHRLDKDTSGVLVLARTAYAAAKLAECFRDRAARKLYCALVIGVPEPLGGRIDRPLAKEAGPQGERVALAGESGLKATTLYQVMDSVGDRAAYVHLSPLTGRTHQLRVHMASLGTPILGDGKYGGAGAFLPGLETDRRLHLHARRLVLPHPRRGAIDITAPLPPHLAETCALLGIEPAAASAFPGDDL